MNVQIKENFTCDPFFSNLGARFSKMDSYVFDAKLYPSWLANSKLERVWLF